MSYVIISEFAASLTDSAWHAGIVGLWYIDIDTKYNK